MKGTRAKLEEYRMCAPIRGGFQCVTDGGGE